MVIHSSNILTLVNLVHFGFLFVVFDSIFGVKLLFYFFCFCFFYFFISCRFLIGPLGYTVGIVYSLVAGDMLQLGNICCWLSLYLVAELFMILVKSTDFFNFLIRKKSTNWSYWFVNQFILSRKRKGKIEKAYKL